MEQLSLSPSAISLLCGVLVALSGIYPLHAAENIFKVTPTFAQWSTLWDARDQEIRNLRQQGVLDIEVVGIKRLASGLGELRQDSKFWYKNCAARYYGVNSIRATMLEENNSNP